MTRIRRTTLIALALLAPVAVHAQRASSRGYGVEAPPRTPPPAPAPVYAPPRVVYVMPQLLYVNPDGTISVIAPYVILADGSMLVTYAPDYQRAVPRCAPPPPPVPAVAVSIVAGSRGQVVTTVPARQESTCYSADTGGNINFRFWR